jgi:hypothetical protein
VTLTFDPPGPQYAITEQCEMPAITATANLQNVSSALLNSLQFQWSVTVVFNSANCPHAHGRVTKHTPISASTSTNAFAIPFTQVRGGDLIVAVSVKVGDATLTAQSSGLTILGTNPSIAALQAAAPASDTFRRLTRLESGLRQFLSPSCPLFSGDNLGGVGLCQLTNPTPTDDQVWSWKANLEGGTALWKSKETTARGFAAQMRKNASFQTLVQAYNSQRAAAATAGGSSVAAPPISITLPDYTDDQLQRETLRGFNGWAAQLHEFRPRVDANGILVVTVAAGASTGTAEWEVLTVDERNAFYDAAGIAANHRGDVNYVNDVMKKDTF